MDSMVRRPPELKDDSMKLNSHSEGTVELQPLDVNA